jgi:(2Fe-2S) ferredoxin
MNSRPAPFLAAAFVCTNQRPDGHPKPCCAGRGSLHLRDELKRMVLERGLGGRVKVFQSGCLSHCELGPTVVTFPDGQVYTGVTEADLPALVEALVAAAAAATPEDLSGPG